MLLSNYLLERVNQEYFDDREFVKALTNDQVYLHHTASARGYVRSKEMLVNTYDGKFGRGFTLEFPNNAGFTDQFGRKKYSNNYHRVEYWIYLPNLC